MKKCFIRSLIFSIAILVVGGTALNSSNSYSMENLTAAQQWGTQYENKEKIHNALNFTDNELMQDIDVNNLSDLLYHLQDYVTFEINTINNVKKPVYNKIFNQIENVCFRCVLNYWDKDCNQYALFKKELEHINFKRPQIINITPINNEDTINFAQFWYYISNRTEQIKLEWFNNIKNVINSTKGKHFAFDILLDNAIRSGAAELYSFVCEIGKVICDVSEQYQNNELVYKVLKQTATSLSLLENIKHDIFPLYAKFQAFNYKVLQQYSSNNNNLNTEVLSQLIDSLKSAIGNIARNNLHYSNKNLTQYHQDCLNIVDMFRECFASLTAHTNKNKKELHKNEYEAIHDNKVQFLSKDYLFSNWEDNQSINKLVQKNSSFTLAQLLDYFINKILLATSDTIRNINNSIMNRMQDDCLSLYNILHENINNFVDKIQPITTDLFNFLRIGLKQYPNIKKNNYILSEIIGNLQINIEDTFQKIKNYQKNKIANKEIDNKQYLKSKNN